MLGIIEQPLDIAMEDGMSRKVVKRPLGWTLVDENIENVEHVKLEPAVQRELGCLVGEHVFLEYPWAYVPRDLVVKLAKLPNSPLSAFQEEIEAYDADTFLVGYSSTELLSDRFVICLTEKAKHKIQQRNKDIRGIILRKVVSKLRKIPGSWNSLGSDSEIDEISAKKTRGLFEIEIVLPAKMLGSSRSLGVRDSNSCRDGYMQLVRLDEKFENISRKCISRSVQTHLQSRESFVQTHLGDFKNAWTQYVYEDTLNSLPVEEDFEEGDNSNEGESEQDDKDQPRGKDTTGSRERTALEIFLETRLPEIIDTIRYNTAINLHTDDIKRLSRWGRVSETFSDMLNFYDYLSFPEFVPHRAVSDVSVHPKFLEYLAISYVSHQAQTNEFQTRVLLWKLSNPLRPKLALQDHREIHSICFCPQDGDILIGGCSSGQVLLWNVKAHLTNDCDSKSIKLGLSKENNLPVLRPLAVSGKHYSHHLPIRRIHWLPAKCRIESTERRHVSSYSEFLTISEDGTVLIWNLFFHQNLSSLDEEFHEPFEPTCRLKIRGSGENLQPCSFLYSCLPSIGIHREHSRKPKQFSSTENGFIKNLWVGSIEGLIKCTWEEQTFEGKSTEFIECKILNYFNVHDGPVTEIVRSQHFQDALLTVGAHVFAIWKDDDTDCPLFWRKTPSLYTTCSWASVPGVFLLACQDGSVEMWDVKNDSNRAIFSQVVSCQPITRLILLPCPTLPIENTRMMGVGDCSGLFRMLQEPKNVRNDDTIERMDWFQQYICRESRRKKDFVSWQNDFLVNDSAVIAKRMARRVELQKREAEEAKQKFQAEREIRLKLQAEERARSVPIPKDVAWKSNEFDRMKEVLLSKKNIIPSELEAKMLPLAALNVERDAILRKVQDKIAHQEAHYSNAVLAEFPKLLESKVETVKDQDSIVLELSVNDCTKKFEEIRRTAHQLLRQNKN